MRKHFFVNEENGYLTTQQTRRQPVKDPMTGALRFVSMAKKDVFVQIRR